MSHTVSNTSMLFLSLFVLLPMSLSYLYALNLEKGIILATLRGTLQLFAIGYVLTYLFSIPSFYGVITMLAVMIVVATFHASKRGDGLPNVKLYVLGVIVIVELLVLCLWLIFDMIAFIPEQVIPMSGMVIGNSMIAIGLAIDRMKNEFAQGRGQILAALSLGATDKDASKLIMRKTLKAAMIPNVDGLKTIGLVQLPGMMTGLILGGVSPIDAIRYQLIISLSIFSAVSLSAILVTGTMYRVFFTKNMQLKKINFSNK